MALYRDHRGSLAEAMKTVITVSNKQDIIDHLNNSELLTVTDVKVELYTYDSRIDWLTHIVQFKSIQTGDEWCVAGWTNEYLAV